MKVKLFPSDTASCGSYRMIWPARALGPDVEVCLPGESISAADPGCDVVVFQRPTSKAIAEGIGALQRAGVRVVIELDDDYANIPVGNVARAQFDPKADPFDNWNWLSVACSRADRVVVTTKQLDRRYGNGHGVVVPNFVPQRYLDLRVEENESIRLGWSGNLEVHARDLEAAGPGVAVALNRSNAQFWLVGSSAQAEQVRQELRLPHTPVATGWAELKDYPTLLSELDVGIVPLEASTFNESKSYLKGLEYASLGIPFVASPTEPYRELAAMGAGLVAERRKDWARLLTPLLNDRQYRAEQADRAYAVASENTIERNAWRFLEAWTS